MLSKLLTAASLAVAAPMVMSAPAAADTLLVQPGVPGGPYTGIRAFQPNRLGMPFGQSFTAIDSTLTSIGFQFEVLNPQFTGASYTLSLVSGEGLTGPSLLAPITFTLPTTLTATPTFYDIALGGLGVTVGQQYTAVLTSSDTRALIVFGPDYSYVTSSLVSGDTYAGGRALNIASLYPDCPDAAPTPCDFNFRVIGTSAAAAAVPEPASWAAMLGGLALAGVALRRRRPAVTVA